MDVDGDLPRQRGLCLATNTQLGDDGAVALHIVIAHVVQETTTATDELHEATTRVVITLVDLKVLSKMRDAIREDGDLDLGRPGVGVVELVLSDDGLLFGHCAFPFELCR